MSPAASQAKEQKRPPRLARFRIVINALIAVLIATVLLPGPLEALFADFASDLDQPLPRRARGHYQFMKRHLEAPFDGYGVEDVFVDSFAAVMLSHAAIGLMNVGLSDPTDERREELTPLLDETARRVLSPEVSPYGRSPAKVANLGDSNLYLSHVNLVLGARRLITKNEAYDDLHQRLTTHLVRKSLADGDGHARSYERSAKFPADQSATLASIYLYDLCHGTRLSERPVARWLAYMKSQATHRPSGLHRSSLSPSYHHAKLPRGCALSWTTLYMAQFAPDQALDLYRRYREQFTTDVAGWGGFREFPPGVERGMDVDSGPIFFGMGMAATGLGLGPARLFRDRRAYVSIQRTASSLGLPRVVSTSRSYLLSPILGEAILLHGTTARRWSGELPGGGFEDPPPFPWGALILAGLLLAWLALALRKVLRLWRALRS
jgi:hypothetical protein